MGGYEMNSVESLDLVENEGWTEIQPMTIERYGPAAVEINRKIYVLGRNHFHSVSFYIITEHFDDELHL